MKECCVNENLPFLVIGHRGCAGVEPENTLRAVRTALAAGCQMIEVDVHLVEGELVVIHDFSVDRTTNGAGDVDRFKLSNLRKLDAGKGEKVPLLREVLELCLDRATLNIELKGEGTAGAVVSLLRLRGGADEAVVSSFDWQKLKQLRQEDALLPIAVLLDDGERAGAALAMARELGAVSLNPSLDILTDELVVRAHQQGLKVSVFTVRDPADVEKVLRCEADACFADDPQMVFEML